MTYRNPYWQRAEPDYLLDPETESDQVYVSLVEEWWEEDNRLWSSPYQAFLDGDYWQRVRQAVFTRDGHQCVQCGRAKDLHAHHRQYCQRGTELNNLHLLETLCSRCHDQVHGHWRPSDSQNHTP